MFWTWIDKRVVLAVHAEQIAEHGGQPGLREEGLLDSALARARNKAAYGESDVTILAAAYGYGIVANHPFVDGNKRTGFVAMELFLRLNGHALRADDTACLQTFLSLAEGALTEARLTSWLRDWVEADV